VSTHLGRPTERRADVETLDIGVERVPWSGRSPAARVRIALLALLVAITSLYLFAVNHTTDRLPRHAQVGGVTVGGLDRPSAEALLRRELTPQLAQPIQVQIGSDLLPLTPSRAGLGFDYPGSLPEPVAGGRFNPLRVWGVLTGGTATEPVLVVDERRLSRAIRRLSQEHDQLPQHATLEYAAVGDGSVTVTPDVDGVAIDRFTAAQELRSALLNGSRETVDLPVKQNAAGVQLDAAQRAAARYAAPAVSADVFVVLPDGRRVRITPAVVMATLTFVPRGHELVPRLSGVALLSQLDEDLWQLVEPNEFAAAVLPALTKTGADRTVALRSSPDRQG
jgi:hypothetical protein